MIRNDFVPAGPISLVLILLATLVFTDPLAAQGRQRQRQLLDKYDENKDGWLNRAERMAAMPDAKKGNEGRRRGRGGRGGFGGRRGGTEPEPEDYPPLKKLTPDTVKHYPDVGLYKMDVVRTIFLEFEDEDWDEQLTAFRRTDISVPAKMTVDGKVYENVGLRYRGNTSFSSVGKRKRSLNLMTDVIDPKQRLYGYKTLNLLNCHTDASFLREVVFSMICRKYIAASKANFVRVVINGENWGIYANVQQINKDFTDDHYGTRGGVRWKVPPNFSGDGGLKFLGDDVADYKACYDLKNANAKDPWTNLIEACRRLEEDSDEKLEKELSSFLDVDEVLWHLALDNVFQDGDGYHSRASDYVLYEDPSNRFHLIFHDNNEVMRNRGGGPRGPGGRGNPGNRGGGNRGTGGSRAGGNRGGTNRGGGNRGGRRPRGPIPDPLGAMNRQDRPLLYRMLRIPSFRARYLHHVQTIVDEWLDWEKIGPVFQKLHAMIDEDIKADRKRLYSYSAFQSSLEGEGNTLRAFVEKRRKELLEHKDLAGARPTIAEVEAEEVKGANGPRLQVRATVGADHVGKVLLYSRDRRLDTFVSVPMFDDGEHGDGAAGDSVYGATIPSPGKGRKIRYYVEVRAPEKIGTTTFRPRRAEARAIAFRFSGKKAKKDKDKK